MLTFGRYNSTDVLHALKEKAAVFSKSPLNGELANQCAIDAWALCDWIFKEHGRKLGLQKLVDFQKDMKTQCPSLALFQDVANATKHRDVTRYVPKLKEAQSHDGAFDRDAFQADAFDVSALVLVVADGTEIWFDNALQEVIHHWEQFFADHKIHSSPLPSKLSH